MKLLVQWIWTQKQKFLKNIFENYRDMTIINIAHKGVSLNQCERIYDLDKKIYKC